MFLFRILCTLELKALALHFTSSVPALPRAGSPGLKGSLAARDRSGLCGVARDRSRGRGVARDHSRGRGVVSTPDQTPAKGAKRQPPVGRWGPAPHSCVLFGQHRYFRLLLAFCLVLFSLNSIAQGRARSLQFATGPTIPH